MEMDNGDITIEDGEREIDNFIARLIEVLDTQKQTQGKALQHMKTYTCIVRLSDEQDESLKLYEIYSAKIEHYIKNRLQKALQSKMGDSQEFLQEYVKQWKKFTIFVMVMKKMFDYLDRYFLKNAGSQSLTLTALNLFRKMIFQDRKVQLRRCVLEEIYKDRENQIIDKDLLKQAILQYIYMGFDKKTVIKKIEGSSDPIHWTGEKNLMLYDNEFQTHLLEKTQEYYKKQASKWQTIYSCSEYIQKVSEHLKKEEENADYFLQDQTKQLVIDILLKEAVEMQAESLTQKESGCNYMFTEKKIEQLTMMYKVFCRTPKTLSHIINKMNPYIMQEGEKILKNEENLKDPLKFTMKLLDFKAAMDDLIEQAFTNDMKFQKSRDQSFQNFMNECDRTPHYIALYCDNEFKKGFKSLTDDEIDKKLDAVVRIFCCLHGRDTFIATFTKLLAQRLLNKTSVSNSAEELMINKLQVECGHNTVNKIKTMFEDMNKSKQVMEDFKTQLQSRIGNNGLIEGIEFNSEILTSGHWPFQEVSKCTLPRQMRKAQEEFSQFYVKKFQNRKIIWLYNHGQLLVQTNYLQKKYQVHVNCFQAAILCLFNENDVLTVQDILDRCQITDDDLKEACLKLCNPKSKMLLKENQKKPNFEKNEKIRVNESFESQNIRVNMIPVVSTVKMATEDKGIKLSEVDAEVMKERGLIIDATCVRIMKTRKMLSHNELLQSIIHQIKLFQAQPQMIRKRIESLIEREYLERDPKNKGCYIYMP